MLYTEIALGFSAKDKKIYCGIESALSYVSITVHRESVSSQGEWLKNLIAIAIG
ncbi:MAG: hypothetical protein AAGE96_01125 [Cyanobacteria bacterium P01_G01_bin.19]